MKITDSSDSAVSTLFASAFSIPAVDRRRFLAERCSDPHVIDEVLDLLQAHDQVVKKEEEDGSWLQLGKFEPPMVTDGVYLGKTLKSFRVDRIEGVGGMGTVYQAHDTSLDRRVAIKAIHLHLRANPAVSARFEREARSLAKLNHPNVVRVIELLDESLLVMEYVPGETLRDEVKTRGPLPCDDVIEIATLILNGLEAAHTNKMKIIHRDLKPSNIKIPQYESGSMQVKILDFGLARLMEDETVSGFTQGAGGTPKYMSPEQFNELHSVDERSDLYSLGVIMIEMLTGKAPVGMIPASLDFVRANPIEYFAEFRSDVPPKLARLIAKTLSFEPEDRYQSASGMRAALGLVDTSDLADVSPRSWGRALAWAVPLLLILAAGAWFLSSVSPFQRPAPSVDGGVPPVAVLVPPVVPVDSSHTETDIDTTQLMISAAAADSAFAVDDSEPRKKDRDDKRANPPEPDPKVQPEPRPPAPRVVRIAGFDFDKPTDVVVVAPGSPRASILVNGTPTKYKTPQTLPGLLGKVSIEVALEDYEVTGVSKEQTTTGMDRVRFSLRKK